MHSQRANEQKPTSKQVRLFVWVLHIDNNELRALRIQTEHSGLQHGTASTRFHQTSQVICKTMNE